MSRYLITYLGGNQPSTQEEGQHHFAKYKEWLRSIGDDVISPANPLKHIHTISPEGAVSESSRTSMSGFTIIEAESMFTALDIAKACPFLDIGGSLEVAELVQMQL